MRLKAIHTPTHLFLPPAKYSFVGREHPQTPFRSVQRVHRRTQRRSRVESTAQGTERRLSDKPKSQTTRRKGREEAHLHSRSIHRDKDNRMPSMTRSFLYIHHPTNFTTTVPQQEGRKTHMQLTEEESAFLAITRAMRHRGCPAPVIHHFRPLITTSSLSTLTVVCDDTSLPHEPGNDGSPSITPHYYRTSIFVASEEATLGSVMAKQDRISPRSKGSSHCSFCWGEPKWKRVSIFPAPDESVNRHQGEDDDTHDSSHGKEPPWIWYQGRKERTLCSD